MNNIWIISDTHFNHNKDFIWKARGFNSVEEMNETIIKNWNDVIQPDDVVYHLGDVMLNDNDGGLKILKNLKGKIHIIIGNHDTDSRIELYKNCYNVVEVVYATRIKYKGKSFYLSHYPTLTSNLQTNPDKTIYNLFGHTHSTDKFYEDQFYMYNVACDAHNCTPVSIDQIIEDIQKKVK